MRKRYISLELKIGVFIAMSLCMILPIDVNALEPNVEVYNEFDIIMETINKEKQTRSTNHDQMNKALKDLDNLKEHIYSMKEWPIE